MLRSGIEEQGVLGEYRAYFSTLHFPRRKKKWVYLNIENILDNLQGALVKSGKLASQSKTSPRFKSEHRIQLD